MTSKAFFHAARNKILFNWLPFIRPAVYFCFPPNETPVFILGNQKSGTSAIAALLAKATRNSYDIDLGGLRVPEYEKIYFHKSLLPNVIRQRAAIEFSKDIVKEPNLTFLYSELRSLYPKAKFVFIVRDPRANIRSILNRLNIPGNLSSIDVNKYPELSPMWHAILLNKWVGNYDVSINYIGRSSERWQQSVNSYLESPDNCVLVRYEDFDQEKIATIEAIATALNLPIQADISPYIDIQYQPAGLKTTDYLSFFGSTNLNIIQHQCATGIRLLEYPLIPTDTP